MAAPLGMLCHAAGRGKETAPALLGLVGPEVAQRQLGALYSVDQPAGLAPRLSCNRPIRSANNGG